MRHVETALNAMPKKVADFISIENASDEKGVPPIVSFRFQSDPVKEVGVNGLQVDDLLQYTINLLSSLNGRFPCQDNIYALESLFRAKRHLVLRTEDRKTRKVEGKMQV